MVEKLVHVTEEVWNEMRDREREDEIHPCTAWKAEDCMCKGACGCHWIQSMKSKITANDIKELLKIRHEDDVYVNECYVGGGTRIDGFMDAWAMKKSWAKPNITGYEIKVSRRDFVQDNKWQKYLEFCNEFYFVAPREVIKDEEVPVEAGLIVVSKGGKRLYTKKKAPWKKLEKGAVENFLKSILFSRVKILDKARIYNQGDMDLKRWEDFVSVKEENRNYGRALRGKIRTIYNEKIEKVQNDNFRLERENRGLKEVKEILGEMGIDLTQYGMRRKIENVLTGIDLIDLRKRLMKVKGEIDVIAGKMIME